MSSGYISSAGYMSSGYMSRLLPPSEEGAPRYQDAIFGSGGHSRSLPPTASAPPFSPVSPPGTNPLPCEHHRGRSLTYNLKDKRSDPYHLISNIKANAETRDNYHLALFFQSTAQPLKRESSPTLKTKLQILRNTSCSRVTLSFCRAFKREKLVERRSGPLQLSSGPPLVPLSKPY